MLGTADVEEFVDQQLVEVADWELNFKVLKAAARDAERLPNEVKVRLDTHTHMRARTYARRHTHHTPCKLSV